MNLHEKLIFYFLLSFLYGVEQIFFRIGVNSKKNKRGKEN